MRNKVVIAAILVAIALFAWVKSPREITNYPSANTGVVAFGDSLTYGTGGSAGGGFVKMITDDLGLPITNLGVVGDTTAGALQRIDSVTKRAPKVTILLLGGNDFLKGVPEEETFKNLATIIERIHQSGSIVILVGLEPLISNKREREMFEGLVDKYKTAYVPDILEGIYGHLDMMSDSLHPNDLGYRLMAKRIEPELKRMLAQ